jgi:hypothetical protein
MRVLFTELPIPSDKQYAKDQQGAKRPADVVALAWPNPSPIHPCPLCNPWRAKIRVFRDV